MRDWAAQLGVATGPDGGGDGLGLGQIHGPGEKRPGGELAGGGQSGTVGQSSIGEHGQQRGRTYGVQLDAVLSRVAAQGAEDVALGRQVSGPVESHPANNAPEAGARRQARAIVGAEHSRGDRQCLGP